MANFLTDPMFQKFLLSMGAGMMGPSRNFGEALGRGVQAGNMSLIDAIDMQQRLEALKKLRDEERAYAEQKDTKDYEQQLGLVDYKQQLENAQLDKQREAFNTILGGVPGVGGDSAGSGDATASPLGNLPPPVRQSALALSATDPKAAMKYLADYQSNAATQETWRDGGDGYLYSSRGDRKPIQATEEQKQQISNRYNPNIKDGQIWNPDTQRFEAAAGYTDPNAGKLRQETSKQKFDQEHTLSQEYQAQTKDMNTFAGAVKELRSVLPTATSNPKSALAAGTKFMKMLDPGSVVRESELGMALGQQGLIDTAASFVQKIQQGQTLTPAEQTSFYETLDAMEKTQSQSLNSLRHDYRRRAGQYGLNHKNIIGGGDLLPSGWYSVGGKVYDDQGRQRVKR